MKVRIYQSTTGKPSQRWRWSITGRNGRRIGASSEGFVNSTRCIENLEMVSGPKTWAVVAGAIDAFEFKRERK